MPDMVVGGVYELYSVHVRMNSATYTTPVSDDFRQNAVNGLTPTQPTRLLCPAYATNATVDGWYGQLRQKGTQV